MDHKKTAEFNERVKLAYRLADKRLAEGTLKEGDVTSYIRGFMREPAKEKANG